MRGRAGCLIIGLLAGLLPSPLARAEQSVTAPRTAVIASAPWEGQSNVDGTGIYWDIMRALFTPVDIAVETVSAPYKRATAMVRAGEADLYLGAFLDEVPWALFPEQFYDAERLTAVIRRDRAAGWVGEESLSGRRVGYILGYDYAGQLVVPVDSWELPERESGLRMVVRGRLDAFLDARTDVTLVLERNPALRLDLTLVPVKVLPLYPAFADTPRGRRLRTVYEARIQTLLRDGTLEQLYLRHDFSFAEFRQAMAQTGRPWP